MMKHLFLAPSSFLAAFCLLSCQDRGSPTSEGNAPFGVWGSDRLSLTTSKTGADLRFLNTSGCVSTHGAIDQPIPNGSFSLSGTCSVEPSPDQHAVQYTGIISGSRMTIRVSIPDLRYVQSFVLTFGASESWPDCFYP
jgi:hypothetical protein